MTMAEWDADARQPSLYDICQVLKELRTQVDTFKGKSRKRMTDLLNDIDSYQHCKSEIHDSGCYLSIQIRFVSPR